MKFTADGKISDEENKHMQAHVQHIQDLLDKLRPRQPLDWVSLFVRVGIALVLFFLLIAPPYSYLRAQYLTPIAASQSSATGTVSIRPYAPEIPASEASIVWGRRDVDGPVAFTHSQDFKGMTAGIVPADLSGQPGVAVFWTEPQGNKLVLRKLVTDEFFRATATVTSTLWDDQSFTSAAAISSGTRSLVAAAYHSGLGQNGTIALQTFDKQGKALHARVNLEVAAGESLEDIQAVPWGAGWALITHIPKGPDAALFDPTKIELRLLDENLAVTSQVELGISGYEIGSFPLVMPTPDADGYAVIVPGHPSIRSKSEPTGDLLYAFQFSASKSLTRVLRLTNQGGLHDFSPSGFAFAPDGDFVVGMQNIPGYSFDDPTVNYPLDTGRAYLRFFDRALEIAGTVIVFDEPSIKGVPDNRGVSHLRQVLIGDRMYVAFDLINADSGDTGKPDRSVQGMWLHLGQQ